VAHGGEVDAENLGEFAQRGVGAAAHFGQDFLRVEFASPAEKNISCRKNDKPARWIFDYTIKRFGSQSFQNAQSSLTNMAITSGEVMKKV
jgi:hypothetical protein